MMQKKNTKKATKRYSKIKTSKKHENCDKSVKNVKKGRKKRKK